MNDESSCSRCRRPLPADAPGGQCPCCLIDPPSIDRDVAPTAAMGPATGFVPPTISELQAHFTQFDILDFLGRGGMGAVYLAKQKSLDRLVALKILPPSIGETPGFEDRFVREGRALAKLNHPGIVGVYDFGKAGPYAFLAMEYVDGVNLRSLLAEGHLKPEEALQIVPLLCDALQAAHRFGIVHRDIKPENILLTTDGQVKVADFGVAKMAEPLESSAQKYTRYGSVVGTYHYMAPEQIERPAFVDHRADLYSLGVVFYEMLTGELPLGRFPSPSYRAGVDRRLDEIVLKALEKQPDLRYGCASQIKTDVQSIGDRSFAPRKTMDQLNSGRVWVQKLAGQAGTWLNRQTPATASATRAANADFNAQALEPIRGPLSKALAIARNFSVQLYDYGRRAVEYVSVPTLLGVVAWIACLAGIVTATDARHEAEAVMMVGLGLLFAYTTWRIAYMLLRKEEPSVIQRLVVVWPLSILAVGITAILTLWPIVLGCFACLTFLFAPSRLRPEWMIDASDIIVFSCAATMIATGLNYAILCLVGLFIPELIQQVLKPFEAKLNKVILLVILGCSVAVITLGVCMALAFANTIVTAT